MEATALATRHSAGFILALGLLGGAGLIATAALSNRGPVIFLPYTALLVIAAIFLRRERVQPFARRFALSFGAFAFSTILFYMFIDFNVPSRVSLLGHAWRLGLVLAIGAALCLAIAQLTLTRSSE